MLLCLPGREIVSVVVRVLLSPSMSEECSLRKARPLLQLSRFLPSKMGCNSMRDVMGDMYWHHSVMQAGWNVVQCSNSALAGVTQWTDKHW